MQTKFRNILLGGGVALICLSMAVAALDGTNIKNSLSIRTSATDYTLTLNSSNAPSALTSSYQANVSGTFKTSLNNTVSLDFTIAKSLSGGFVQLGNHGTIYNCVSNNTRISGIASVKATFSGGTLYLKKSPVVMNNGGAFFDDTVTTLSSGTAANLGTNADCFLIEAGDSAVSITSLVLTYICDVGSASYDYTKVYNVEDFESYTNDGVGYDNSHTFDTSTNLRSAFYSTYYGGGTNPLDGSGWSVMGSTDYVTYNGTIGRNNSKCALVKVNNGNYFSYIQSKHYYGIPYAIGRGNKLSVWIHAPYTDKTASAVATSRVQITLIAYYNTILNRTGTNEAATQSYYIYPGSGWCEYTVDLDSTKNVYAFGIHLTKLSSGTMYIPIDDVKIYTTTPFNNGWLKGTYLENLTIAGNSIPTLFVFSDVRKEVVIRLANNTNVDITNYEYNTSTKKFTIETTGGYLSMTYGTITGTYNSSTDKLTNVGLSGSIKSYVTNNNSLTIPKTAKYWNCDGTTSELQSTFKRRYNNGSGLTVDTTNADRIVSVKYNRTSGNGALKLRTFSGGPSTLNLNSDINQSNIKNIGFWVFNSRSTDVTIRLWYYTSTNFGGAAEIGSVTAYAQGWSWCCMGFGASKTVRNFQLYFDQVDTTVEILVDDICLYK